MLLSFLPLHALALVAVAPQRVAIVTGASRGIGKGMAIELGRAGFCVHCVGRSSRASGQTTERAVAADAGELTVDATAEVVTAAGGRGVAVAADPSVEMNASGNAVAEAWELNDAAKEAATAIER